MGFLSAVLFIVSVVIQQEQASRAKAEQRRRQQEAEAAADAAKGIPLVVDGVASMLPIVYGRALVGGTRCYRQTFNAYTYAKGASDIEFKSGTGLLANQAGIARHEFLLTQQALCYAPISAVYDVLVDGRKIDGEYYNELTGEKLYNETSVHGTVKFEDPFKDAVVAHVSKTGSASSALAVANDSSRSTAYFTDTAYATCAFKYNRDDPKYSGIPEVQFYIEGRLVKSINKVGDVYTLSATTAYSNNPAYCLLDYLMNPVFGLGLEVASIDLKTFYDAAVICGMVELSNIEKQGLLWKAKGGQRDVNRFECNLALDTTRPVRENIEALLSTMTSSNLIWSSGQYKLTLDYPEIYNGVSVKHPYVGSVVQYYDGNANYLYRSLSLNSYTHTPTVGAYWEDAIDAYITDADIVREGDTTLVWPNAQVRLNYATVKFLNEINEFKEDTVSWPSKSDTVASVHPFGDINLPQKTLYQAYLYEDSGIALETEEFAKGVVTKNLAQARAEQIVRESRNSITYEFAVNRNFIDLEPGDIVKLTSEILGIPGEVVQLTAVNPDAKGLIKLSGKRFDAATFAWNANDTEATKVTYIYDTTIPQPTNLAFSSIPGMSGVSSGRISWNTVAHHKITEYNVYITRDTTLTATTAWMLAGTVRQNTGVLYLDLPLLSTGIYTIAVASSINGAATSKSTWPTLVISADPNQFYVKNLKQYKRSDTVPSTPLDGSYSFITHTFTPSNGWTETPTAFGSPLYYTTADVLDNDIHEVTAISWSSPVLVPVNNKYTEQIIVYTTGTNTAIPTGGAYNFTTKIVTPPTSVNIWTAGVPDVSTTGLPIYASHATAESVTNAGLNTNTLSWSAPVLAIAARAINITSLKLYRWSSTIPTVKPNVTGNYTWATQAWSGIAGSDYNTVWYSAIPANPGNPNLKLITCELQISTIVGTAVTAFNFAAGSIYSSSQNGANGTKTAYAAIYRWAISIPSGYAGTTTYTWATHATGVVDANWKTTPSLATAAVGSTKGMSLWEQSVFLNDSAEAATTSIVWSSGTSILPIAYDYQEPTTYYLELSNNVIVKDSTALDIAGAVNQVNVSMLQKTGSGLPVAIPGAVWTIVETSGSDTAVTGVTSSATSVTATAAYYTLRMYSDSSKTQLLDTQTLPVVLKSQPSVTYLLSNDDVTVPAAFDGSSAVLTGASSTMFVYIGATEYTGVTYSHTASAGITPASGTSKTFTVTGMTADSGYVDMTATSALTGPVTKRFTLSKNKQGTPGINGTPAKYVTIAAPDGQLFSRANSTLAFSPTTLTLTASVVGDTATYLWYKNGVSLALTTASISPASSAPGIYKVVATFTGGGTASDEITLLQLTGGKDGAAGTAAVGGLLTNESHTVACNSDGTGVVLTGATGSFNVYSGTTLLTTGVTYSVVAGSAVTASFVGNTYTVTAVGTWALLAETATVTLRATITATATVIDKVFTITKAFKGGAGAVGFSTKVIELYSTTNQAVPANNAVSYTISTNAISGNGTWSLTMPAATTSPTYMTTATLLTATPSSPVTVASWTAAVVVAKLGLDGAIGASSYTATIYRQTPIGIAPTAVGSSYDFATGVLTPPTNWTVGAPNASIIDTWACDYVFTGAPGTTVYGAGDWKNLRVDSKLGSNGAGGTSVNTVELYQVAASAPAVPTGTTYDFSTNLVTGTLGSWTQAMPAPTTNPVYMTTCTFTVVAPVTTQTRSVWTTPVSVARNGSNGTAGTSQVRVVLYSATSGATAPTSVQYTITGNVLGTVAGGTGTWTLAAPAVPAYPGAVYVTSATCTTTTPGTATAVTGWSAATIYAQKGADGVGTQGTNAPVIKTAYAVSTATTVVSAGTSAHNALPATGAGFTGGTSQPWSITSSSTTLTAGQYQYMMFGSDNGTTVTWETPFLTTLKVGNLSALGVNTGALTVSDVLTMGTSGVIKNTKSSYADTASGYYIGGGATPQIHFGNTTGYLKWSAADGLQATGLTIKDTAGTVILASGSSLSSQVNAQRPYESGATVGAAFGVNITGTINSGNVSTYIASAAIGNAQIGGSIQSSNWNGSTTGWLLDRAGNFYANSGTFRGSITGATGTFSGALSAATGTLGALTIASNGNIKSGQTAFNTGTGFYLGDDAGTPKFSIGNSAGTRMYWNGTDLYINTPTFEPFTASIPSGNLTLSLGPGLAAYGNRTVSVSGGKAPYAYAWVLQEISASSAGYITATGVSTNTLYTQGTADGTTNSAECICLVRDANGRISTASFVLSAQHAASGA